MVRIVLLAALSLGALPLAAVPVQAGPQDLIRQVLADFDRIDADRDGALSRGEYRDFQVARWPRIDRSGDGALTLDDFPRPAGGRARALLAGIAVLDSNADGRISLHEFADGAAPVLCRADLNGDTLLTRAELGTAATGSADEPIPAGLRLQPRCDADRHHGE